MNNNLKSKTRLTFIQIIFENLSTKKSIKDIFDVYKLSYKSTFYQEFKKKKKIKFEFNSNFLEKLVNFFIEFTNSDDYVKSINNYVDFKRKFEKWDIINKAIIMAILSEIYFSEDDKKKIIFNDYLNISKLFIDQSDLSTINAIVDKIINEKK
tara:strand:- start:199 stop:657 length:459 start_codon:yes stop_codon:yes gene_type:complete